MIAAIVQARMSSQRLPGKVLRPIAGRPVLDYVLEGLAHAESLDGVVVATSTAPSDDEIADFCARRGVRCHRGSLDDVAARFASVVQSDGLDAFVRVNGDSPCLDHCLLDEAVRLFESGTIDLVTNVFPRTFPRGQSVEVVSARAFAVLRAEMEDDDEREHVTLAFYRRPERYRIRNLTAEDPAPDERLVLDTEEDAKMLERLLSALDRPHWQYRWDELLALSRSRA